MINLLPPDVKSSVRFAKINVVMLQYVIVIGVSIFGMVALMFYGRANLNSTQGDLEQAVAEDLARVATLEEVNTEANELSATVSTIGTLLNQEVKFSFVIQEIGSIMPSGAVLSAIAISQDTTKPLRISVNIVEAETAGVLQQNLIESDLFIGADILNVTKGASPTYSFSAELEAYYNPFVPLNTLDDPDVELPDIFKEALDEEVSP